MTAVFAKHGIQFQYPENWQLVEEDEDWPREISVESPGGAFWALHLYSTPTDPRELLADVVRAMRQEYADVEIDSVEEELGLVCASGCDMSFFYLDLVVTCHARSFTLGDRTFLLLTQAEDREYDRLEPVFRAMTVSLLRESGLAAGTETARG